jgi:transcription elongation factor B subunit 1
MSAKAAEEGTAHQSKEPQDPELPPVEYVTLKSSDGHEFRIMKECAVLSGAIRAMLGSSFAEAEKGVIEFKEISTPILEKVIQYLYYARHCHLSKTPPPEFEVKPEIALELLMASNFLDV